MDNSTPVALATEPTQGLRQGTLSWPKVAALGTVIAISGGFSGWNYGLGLGGWGGMPTLARVTATCCCHQ